MFKKSIVITDSIDQVKYDRNFWRVWKHAHNPKFFTYAVDKYKHYTNPVAYESKGVYYIFYKYGSLEALIELGQNEIILDIIDLNQNEVIEFLLSFQYHEHKETRCMAELFKITLEYITTPEGKKWLKTITKSDDKEEQFSELFGISRYAAKCYLKLILPGNEKYLDKLAEDKNYRPSKGYSECCENEKSKPGEGETPGEGGGEQTSTTKCKAPGKSTPDGSSTDATIDSGKSAPSDDVETTDQPTSREPTSDQDGSNEEEYLEHLKKYEKGDSTPNEEFPAQPLAQRVLVMLCDGKQLELVGDIKLTVDGKIISNTDQLEELRDGNWGLPTGFDDVSLTLVSLGNFWADF